jgi:hypothetical protein
MTEAIKWADGISTTRQFYLDGTPCIVLRLGWQKGALSQAESLCLIPNLRPDIAEIDIAGTVRIIQLNGPELSPLTYGRSIDSSERDH